MKQRAKAAAVSEPKTSGEEVGHRQADILARLEANVWARALRRSQQRCTSNSCGKPNCAEVCAFGDLRRRLDQMPAARRLFKNTNGPVFEVTVARESGQGPSVICGQ